jgi:hypothetical protein
MPYEIEDRHPQNPGLFAARSRRRRGARHPTAIGQSSLPCQQATEARGRGFGAAGEIRARSCAAGRQAGLARAALASTHMIAMCLRTLFLLLAFAAPAIAEPIAPDDVRVIDGDTLRVYHQQPNVRLVDSTRPRLDKQPATPSANSAPKRRGACASLCGP